MPITVNDLIKKLKKQDPNALVAWRDHDNASNEINAYANFVEESEDSLLAAERETLDRFGKTKIVLLSN